MKQSETVCAPAKSELVTPEKQEKKVWAKKSKLNGKVFDKIHIFRYRE